MTEKGSPLKVLSGELHGIPLIQSVHLNRIPIILMSSGVGEGDTQISMLKMIIKPQLVSHLIR